MNRAGEGSERHVLYGFCTNWPATRASLTYIVTATFVIQEPEDRENLGVFVSDRALCSVRFLIGQFFMEPLGAVAPVGGDAHGFLRVAFFYRQRLADAFHQAGFTGSPGEAFAGG